MNSAATPVTPPGLITASRALARREFLKTIRNPGAMIQSVVFPAMLLMVLLAVFGTAVGDLDGTPYIQRLAPAMVTTGAAFGSLAAAVGLFGDRQSGMFARIRTMPSRSRLAPLAPVLARSISEHARVAGLTAMLTAVAFAFGFRFDNGVAAAVGYAVLAVGTGACFCWIGFSLASRASTIETVAPPISALFLVMLFLSRGMVPIQAFPGWIQPVVRFSPTSVIVLALQRLANGGPLVWPIVGAILWTAAITVCFSALTVRGLRASR